MKIKKSTTSLFACFAIACVASPATADVYECTFKEGQLSRPTPTRVVIEVDDYQREGRLLEIEIPGVVTRPGPITVTRNNIKVMSVKWHDEDYEFTSDAMDKGGRSASNYMRVDFFNHQFSVFLKKGSMKALTRSEATGFYQVLPGQSTGRCTRLS